MIVGLDGLTISELQIGKIFDGDELIVDRWKSGMMTVRKEDDSEIRYFMYDWDLRLIGNSVNHNGRGEIFSTDTNFDNYKIKLQEVGLW